MTKTKTKYPIESFGPQLMDALKRGGREKVVIPFDGGEGVGKRLAHSFQRRIHTLRQRMREEGHPDYVVATRARVSIFWGEKAVANGAPREWVADDQGQRGAVIVIRPQDTEFEDALSKMVVSPLDEEGIPSHEEPTTVPVVAPDALDLLLEELESKK